MKILHIIPDLSFHTGGPVTAIFNLVKTQKALGHEVYLATTYRKEPPDTASWGISVSLQKAYTKWAWAPGFSGMLNRLIPGMDIVHLHMVWEYVTLAGILKAQKYHVPYILRPCGMLDSWSLSQHSAKKKFYLACFGKRLFSFLTTLHFTSDKEMKNSIYDNRVKTFVCPLGVPEALLEARPSPELFFSQYPQLKDKKLIIFASRIHPKKQPDLVIRCFAELFREDRTLRLVIAGSGDLHYGEKLKNLCAELDLTDEVVFTGLLEKQMLWAALAGSKIFVLPSLQENFGLAITEAMAAGCPVVVSNKVDLAADIDRQRAGATCEPTLEANMQVLKKLLAQPMLAQEMASNARKWVSNAFRWKSVTQELIDRYQEVITCAA